MENLINFHKQLFHDNRRWFRVAVIWFLVTIVVGAITYNYKPELLETILKAFQDKFGESPALDINLASAIFFQNVMVAGIAILGGLLFGIIPVIIIGVNGFIFGFIITAVFASSADWFSVLYLVVAGIVPHGILELPAFIFAGALGLALGLNYLMPEAKGRRRVVLKENFVKVLKVVPLLIILLAVAALIEVFLSGKLVN